MIIFLGTKKVGIQSFLIFGNEKGSTIQIPVNEKDKKLFLSYFDRLTPPTVEFVEEGEKP